VLHRPGVGLRSCVTRHCMQCRQNPLPGVLKSPMSMLVWTLSCSPMLP
jgi:hypothetical protein